MLFLNSKYQMTSFICVLLLFTALSSFEREKMLYPFLLDTFGLKAFAQQTNNSSGTYNALVKNQGQVTSNGF
jgi:hypothetical protein